MGHTIAQEERKLIRKLAKLHELFAERNDQKALERTMELGRKAIDREFAIAFCGHFSAGKSSMINSLVGEEILPSSPIPTSANLVKVRSGKEYARVFFKEGKPRLYPAPYDYKTVKHHCRDGDSIKAIEISHRGARMLEDCVILDTPGIDSADDAHRIATESALHLADLIFYVMDYNHVQSELNFMFAKELTDAGKSLYLIVNQIDKHNSGELGFDEFQRSVSDSFAAWGVKPGGIFYTSLKKENLPGNQFDELRQFIKNQISAREAFLPGSISRSLVKVAEDHINDLQDEYEGKITPFEEALHTVPNEERPKLSGALSDAKEKLGALEQQASRFEEEISVGIGSILKNAYLMPFETRELAEEYLKAMQPGFKAGLFFAKQKTMQERSLRLGRFHSNLNDKVQTQIEWHLKEYLLKWMKDKGVQDSGLTASVQSFKVEITPKLLEETVKDGAGLSGDYVLVYTNDATEAVKMEVRKQLQQLKVSLAKAAAAQAEEEKDELLKDMERLSVLEAAYQEMKAGKNTLSNLKGEVFDILYSDKELFVGVQPEELFASPEADEEIMENGDVLPLHDDKPEHVFAEEDQTGQKKKNDQSLEEFHQHISEVIGKLTHSANEINDLPGLGKLSRELSDKAYRLQNRQFTVALFGAFSAGKSSFANALIGEKLLPVSPNPTTAAINKIKPVDGLHPHGTVHVKAKDPEQLLGEVNRSLKLFGLSAKNLNEAVLKAAAINGAEDRGAEERLHASFLKAFCNGFSLFEGRFGSMLSLDLESFPAYVADEEKSCFVEVIEVFYDCPLTREGITLVDTPGADSINARHTGVAFDYIKNSDAILFVTYYNHAFSRADREFLIQLGRVKDAFELDKMFFLVNAVDLAGSEVELHSVLEYVREQLMKYGIRKPNLYPVSSMLALKEKRENAEALHSGFATFEESFYSFIANDLTGMAIDSANAKWEQAVNQLEEMIQSALESSEKKQRRLDELAETKEAAVAAIRNQVPEQLLFRMLQEADELVYYIKQRVFFRFGEFFREAFNPAVLKDDGRDLKKALQSSLEDLLASIGYDFAQELRASTVRVEHFIGKIMSDFQENLSKELKKVHSGLSFTQADPLTFAEMEFEEAFKTMDRGVFRKTLGAFKNPKAFFEKNEKKQMSEDLEHLFQLPADEYLKMENARMKEHYSEALQNQFSFLLDDIEDQVSEFFMAISSAIGSEIPVSTLEEKLAAIRENCEDLH
ncbi:dynamin family protein [Mesobacillus zeae]|uniref:Dynamin family protein n=1 Tax=Mesobacillus zeae TaxID=1917180 RepID=A0A398B8F5_9BACI|nr:dynamin family protein [Mesobacillus zeae]RID84190.1 Dynamin family protein [Mesobacillus zeae]